MRERALLFGDAKSLAAVITEPATPDARRPALVFLDAGVLHHVGPNRVHVRLARELAQDGFLSMRFDFSGIGDSRSRADALPFAESAVAEARQAMDVLAARGTGSFLLFGICSGADTAMRTALQDERVAGAVLVEPYLVEGPGYTVYAYRRKILNPVSWWRLLRGRSELLETLAARRRSRSGNDEPAAPPAAAPVAARPSPEPAMDEVPLTLPSRREVGRQVRALVEKKVDLCFVYAREGPAYHNWLVLLRPEARPALRRGRARLLVLGQTDHIFTPLAAQDRLVAAVRRWANEVAARTAAG